MNNTLRELIYNKQEDTPKEKNEYEVMLNKVRTYISQSHADELAQSITDKSNKDIVKNIINEYIEKCYLHIEGMTMQQLTDKLYGDMVGFGFLDKYISDPEVEEINANSWNDIEVVTKSGFYKISERFHSPAHAEDTLRKMVRLGGLIIDGSNPLVDSYISNGIRISAMIPPVADKQSGVAFSIRKQGMAKITKQELVEWNSATEEMLDFLVFCMNHGISIGVAGKTGSGKTTDLSYLLNSVDNSKRIYTIEETREINLLNQNSNGETKNRVIHTCTRPSDRESANITMNDLLRKALRFTPDIIVVAEMRGAEAMTAQEASRTGHGVITSLHANSARKAYNRILSMCQMSKTSISSEIIFSFIVEAFPIMVFKRKLKDGSRRIIEIVEAIGIKNGVVHANTLYKFRLDNEGSGRFEKISSISDELVQTLRENGASQTEIKQFSEDS